jgi:hypothetical protein
MSIPTSPNDVQPSPDDHNPFDGLDRRAAGYAPWRTYPPPRMRQEPSPESNANTGSGPAPSTGRPIDVAVITDWLQVFIEPDQTTELRALGVSTASYRRRHTEHGFFDYAHLSDMAEAALALSGRARGIYFCMNPLRADILACCANRIAVCEEGEAAADKDVLNRRWLLLDLDPVRHSKVSASAEEKQAAWQVIQRLRDYLQQEGWPDPVLADSGNGYHLLYRIDLPSNDGGILERCLKALARRFDTPQVTIDQKVFNPSRICKLPGTLACKGDSTSDRPHRRSCLLEVPTWK